MNFTSAPSSAAGEFRRPILRAITERRHEGARGRVNKCSGHRKLRNFWRPFFSGPKIFPFSSFLISACVCVRSCRRASFMHVYSLTGTYNVHNTKNHSSIVVVSYGKIARANVLCFSFTLLEKCSSPFLWPNLEATTAHWIRT